MELRGIQYSVSEEFLHALSHGLGLALSLAGLAVLVSLASLRGDAWQIVGCSVFGASLVLLYTASTLYHGMHPGRAKRVFQRLDHAAIFVLIAGTYTPFTLVNLRGAWGWTLFGLVWGLAILGILLRTAFPVRMGKFSVALYLAMGWLVVIAAEPLAHALRPGGLELLVLGGLAYTVGILFYAWERLPFHHAVWHGFVLAGSALHFACVLGYVVPAAT